MYFADEIAIDFPSVTAAIDRMRSSFLGDVAEAPVRLEIALSRVEAYRGRDVRLEVPIRRTCGACGGRGEVWGDRCGGCEGVGHDVAQHALHVAVPPGVRDGACVNVTVVPGRHAPPTRVELRVSVR